MDLRPDNPCDRIGPVLGAQGKVVRHMRALPHGEGKRPPFGGGKKKTEFSDAFTIEAIEAWYKENDERIYVVSLNPAKKHHR